MAKQLLNSIRRKIQLFQCSTLNRIKKETTLLIVYLSDIEGKDASRCMVGDVCIIIAAGREGLPVSLSK